MLYIVSNFYTWYLWIKAEWNMLFELSESLYVRLEMVLFLLSYVYAVGV